MATPSIEKDHIQSATSREDGLYNYSATYLLSLVLDHTEEMIILLDKDLKVLLFNKAAERASFKRRNLQIEKGMSVFDLAPSYMHDKVRNNFSEVLKGNIISYDDKIIREEGNIDYFSSTLKPIYNDVGDIECIITITRDFTERKNDIQQLKDSEQRLRLAMEGSNHGMWDWNIITGETYYSDSYKRMYGYFDEEMTNNISEWEKRIHPDDRELIDKALHEHFNGPEAYHEVTYRLKDKWGNYRWVMARAIITERDANGKPLRMIGTHTDIT
ncbi:MAG TPA: PAS domain-containing protein, partial [Chitinophagaceae bacterium]